MKCAEVLKELEALGTAQNRKVYLRHGAKEPLFGVSFANIDKIARRIKTNHPLATELWNSGNADAQALATKIADPAAFGSAELDRWLKACPSRSNLGIFAGLVAKTPLARAKAEKWMGRKDESIAAAGFDVFASLVLDLENPDADEAFLKERLAHIEAHIHQAKNRVRHSMNGALIAIGGRSKAFKKLAIAAAKRIGKVEVDHGETACKTPIAAPYMQKMWAHKEAKAARAKERAAKAGAKLKKRSSAAPRRKGKTRKAGNE